MGSGGGNEVLRSKDSNIAESLPGLDDKFISRGFEVFAGVMQSAGDAGRTSFLDPDGAERSFSAYGNRSVFGQYQYHISEDAGEAKMMDSSFESDVLQIDFDIPEDIADAAAGESL